MNIIYIFS